MPEPVQTDKRKALSEEPAMRWTLILLVCVGAIAASTAKSARAQILPEVVAELSPTQIITHRFPDFPASQRVAISFADLDRGWSGPALATVVEPAATNRSGPDAVALVDPASPGNRGDLPNDSRGAGVTPEHATPDHITPLTSIPRSASLLGFQVAPALPPMGHSRFCLHYPQECKVHGVDFRKRNIKMTAKRWDELNRVNREVNGAIWGVASELTDTIADWAISPPTGDCKDYAVTKRHQLLALGWPSRSLLLSDVVLPSGDHHLLLAVRMKDGDVVLDNLSSDIRLVSMTYDRYQWTRIQSPLNPMLWMGVQNATRIRAVDLGVGGSGR
jgi:predicted transglutaminase-like cysteine proteinase